MDVTPLKLEVIDDQAAALHMKDLHRSAGLVDEDERVAVLNVASHLVGDDAAERVEALAHVRGMRVQVEAVAVAETEHPLSGKHDQTADCLQREAPAQANCDTIGKTDFADGLLRCVALLEGMAPVHQNHFAATVVDAHRHELAALVGRRLATKLTLPAIEPALLDAGLRTKVAYRLAAAQELLVDGAEVFDCPHIIDPFCGQR